MFLLLMVATILTSCGDPKEKVIIDYIQSNAVLGKVQIDLQPKILEMKEIKSITAQDSLSIFESSFEKQLPLVIESIERNLKFTKEMYKTKTGELREYYSNAERNEDKKKIEEYTLALKNIKENNFVGVTETMELPINSEYRFTSCERYVNEMNRYKEMNPSDILFNIVACTYTIKNPLVGLVTINTEYYFSPDNTKILGESE